MLQSSSRLRRSRRALLSCETVGAWPAWGRALRLCCCCWQLLYLVYNNIAGCCCSERHCRSVQLRLLDPCSCFVVVVAQTMCCSAHVYLQYLPICDNRPVFACACQCHCLYSTTQCPAYKHCRTKPLFAHAIAVSWPMGHACARLAVVVALFGSTSCCESYGASCQCRRCAL